MSKHQGTFSGAPIVIKLNEQAGSNSIPSKVQVLRCGKFSHPEYGDFEITSEILKSMKSNFDSNVRGVDLAIDYAHESDKVAAGWIKSATLSEDEKELWLDVDWTPNGKKVLSDKEFRYLSADFTFDFVNNESKKKHGPTLFGAGLTNRPVIKGMKPVIELQENRNNNGGYEMDPKDKEIQDLKAALEAMKKQKDDSDAQMGAMKAKLSEYEAASKKAAEEKALAEKKEKFKLLLSEKKAVPAQEEAYLAGDMIKFAELSQPIKLNEEGHGGAGATTTEGDKSAEDKVFELAEKMAKEKGITFGEAVRKVKAENAELKKALENKGV